MNATEAERARATAQAQGEEAQQHASWCDGNGSTECWDCGGEGGYHDCGDDCCPPLNPELATDCATCGGEGIIRCPACVRMRNAEMDALEATHDPDWRNR